MKPPTNFNGLKFERDHGVTCWIDEDGNIATSPSVASLSAKVAANVTAETERLTARDNILAALGITAEELEQVLKP